MTQQPAVAPPRCLRPRTQLQLPGLAPIDYTYDANGRLVSTRQGNTTRSPATSSPSPPPDFGSLSYAYDGALLTDTT